MGESTHGRYWDLEQAAWVPHLSGSAVVVPQQDRDEAGSVLGAAAAAEAVEQGAGQG